MRVITIGSDRNLFDRGSAVYSRIKKQAELFDELHIIVFSGRARRYVPIHDGNLHIYPTRSLLKVFYIPDAARRARTIPADILTTQDPFEAGLAGVLGKKGRPLQVQLHTDPFSPYFAQGSLLNRIRLCIMPFVLRRAQGIRVTTTHLKEVLQKKYPQIVPISVLPVFVDITRFSSIEKKQHPRFKTALLWTGRFEKEKNPELALRSLAYARAHGHDVGLTLLGSGSLLPKLLSVTEELHIERWVEFPGWQDPVEYLATASLFLCTSEYEGYGLAVVEALAAGVPVLSTHTGVADEAGAIVVKKEQFEQTLAALLTGTPPHASLRLPLMTEAEYRKVYRDLLTQLCA